MAWIRYLLYFVTITLITWLLTWLEVTYPGSLRLQEFADASDTLGTSEFSPLEIMQSMILIACGLMIVRNSLQLERYQQGFELSALVYGGYGFTRLLAWVVDGQPPEAILVAAAIELVLFGLSFFMLMRSKGGMFYPQAQSI